MAQEPSAIWPCVALSANLFLCRYTVFLFAPPPPPPFHPSVPPSLQHLSSSSSFPPPPPAPPPPVLETEPLTQTGYPDRPSQTVQFLPEPSTQTGYPTRPSSVRPNRLPRQPIQLPTMGRPNSSDRTNHRRVRPNSSDWRLRQSLSPDPPDFRPVFSQSKQRVEGAGGNERVRGSSGQQTKANARRRPCQLCPVLYRRAWKKRMLDANRPSSSSRPPPPAPFSSSWSCS